MDNDKKIVFTIMDQLFEDNNTFSKTPNGFAMLGIKSKRAEITQASSIYGNVDFVNEGEIELKLVSKEINDVSKAVRKESGVDEKAGLSIPMKDVIDY